jgi:hypothetical protein
MAVIQKFYNWQQSPLDPLVARWNVCSPNLIQIRDYLVRCWGGQNLGCHQDRSIVGGASKSSHSYGAALDWGWDVTAHRGPGRHTLDATILPFLINNSKELGVQALHDYQKSRIWRPMGFSGRPADGDGWKLQPAGSQMGQDWARWIHVETHLDEWPEIRSVDERVGEGMRFNWGPARLVDTRKGQGLTRKLNPAETVTVHRNGTVPAEATALDAHITVINATQNGYITVWPTGTRPGVSQVNYRANEIVNNGVTIPLAADGSFRLYAHGGGDITVDVVGYFR